MNPLYVLIGAIFLLVALLFFSFVLLIWGLKQLLTIRNQNDTLLYLLEHISMDTWNEAHLQAGLQEDIGVTTHPGSRIRAA